VCAFVLVPAAHGAVEITAATIGHEGTCRDGALTVAALDLTNTGDKDVTGTAYVKVPLEESAPFVFSRPVDMPAGAHKRVLVYPNIPEGGAASGEVSAGFQPRKGAVSEVKVTIKSQSPDDLLVLVCTDGTGSFNFARMVDPSKWVTPIPGMPPGTGGPGGRYGPGGGPQPPYVSYCRTEDLPDSWKGFADIDLLILDEFSPQAIGPDQERAIVEWVTAGGRLLVTGGEQFRRLSESFIAPYLPVEVMGTTVLGEGLPAMVSRFGGRMEPAPTAVCAGRIVRGGSVVAQGGQPLLAYSRQGLGTVWYAAFSFTTRPVAQWDGAQEVISSILKRGRQYQPGLVCQHAGPVVANALSASASPNPPSFKVISLFLIGYIVCLVPLNYLALRKLDRRELAWVTTPAIVLAFSLLAYGLGFVLKGRAVVLRSVTMIEVQASTGAGAAQSYYSVFSPKKASYRVAFGAPNVDASVPAPVARMSMRGPRSDLKLNTPFEVEAGERDTVKDLLVQMWDQRMFSARAPVVLGGDVKSDLRVGRDAMVVGQVTNALGGLRLEGGGLIFRGQTQQLDALAPGAAVAVRLGPVRPARSDEPPPKPLGWRDTSGPYAMMGSGMGGPMGAPTTAPEADAQAAASLASGPTSSWSSRGGPYRVRADLAEGAAEGFLRQNTYTFRDDEALLLGWADTDALGADLVGTHGATEQAKALVVVHIPVAEG